MEEQKGAAEELKSSRTGFISRKLNLFLLDYFKFVLAGMVLLIIAAGFMFVVKPKYYKVRERIAESNEKIEQEYANLEDYLLTLTRYYNNYQKIDQVQRQKLSDMLPEDDDFEDLFVMMEKMANDQGFYISSIKIDAVKDKAQTTVSRTANPAAKAKKQQGQEDNLGTFNISMHIIGISYEDTKELFDTLEKNLRLMDVVDMTYAPQNGDLNLVIRTYYLKNA